VGVGVNGGDVELGVGIGVAGCGDGARVSSVSTVADGWGVPEEHAERKAKIANAAKPSSCWQVDPATRPPLSAAVLRSSLA